MDAKNSSGNNPNPEPRQQVADKLKAANNVLVTVSTNPSIDQLAACIGLALLLNKLGKHGTAVFSGEVPSTIEFLQPEDTLEKNTDSLRDFIIALDKSKADKLRYKVEDKVVKIFITPYRTSLSDKDLDFSYGDFNVDVVVALGVQKQQDLDQAITAHGRILHDATVISINQKPNGNLGSINWIEESASSLSEMVAGLDGEIGKNAMDGQIATAFLTGIVAETKRFSNEKTTPQTMSISAKLMSAGANQQLVVAKLEPPQPPPPPPEPPKPKEPEPPKEPSGEAPAKPQEKQPEPEKPKPNDGTLQIVHGDEKKPDGTRGEGENIFSQIEIDREGNLRTAGEELAQAKEGQAAGLKGGPSLIQEPPQNDSKLSANTEPELDMEPSTDPLSAPNAPMLNWQDRGSQSEGGVQPPMPEQKLPDVSGARDAVDAVAPSNTPAPDLGNISPSPMAAGINSESVAPANQPFTLPPKPPLPQVVPEHRPQVAGPPSTVPGQGIAPMDMPMPETPRQQPDLISPFGEEDKPSGSPSNPNSPPPPPVPPPPPTTPPVF